MQFAYKIVSAGGQIKEGRLEAVNIHEAQFKLALQEASIIRLQPISKSHILSRFSPQNITLGHISLLDKVMLARHLSTMIRAGMNIDEALDTIASSSSAVMKKRLGEVLAEVKSGNRLADALAKHPRDFDTMFVNMVAIGEASGRLSENLNILATQQQKSYELKAKIRSASIYPIVILLAVFVLVIIVSIFVLPKIIGFFTSLELELPLATKILINTSSFIINFWPYLVGLVALIFIAARMLLSWSSSRLILHRMMLHIPVAGKIIREVNMALFARTLGSLLGSGVTIDKSLEIVSRTLSNEAYRKATINIYHKVLKGVALSEALAGNNYFPRLFNSMCKVGERSGNLSEILSSVAEFYESEVDNITKNLATILEPALLVFIGLVVAFVAISIINPIYDLTSKVEQQ
ncbi:MAG: hypothetical protein C3F02_00210 [Parcubacteria group bacterium]|nr:MAG: hypothetical protein C3F02_00210 [Parcubacteria group bacterium]